MPYTFYNGTNNVTGELLHVYLNGKLIHKSLLINSTDNKNYNYNIVPLYSKSGDYNITTLTNNTNATNNKNNNDVYVDLCAIYSSGSSGSADAFNQDETDLLLYLLAVEGAASSLAAGILGGPIAAGVVAIIFAVGIGLIKLYDKWGGNNGVFFFTQHYWFFTCEWINSPYNQVPNDLKNYGSLHITLYNGDLQ